MTTFNLGLGNYDYGLGKSSVTPSAGSALSGGGGGGGWFSNNWGNLLVGAISTAGTMWAAREQSKQQSKQYDYQKQLLEEQRQYAQQQYEMRMNSPAAKLAPILMRTALQLYAPKLEKYGASLPLDEIFAALGLGSGNTLQSSMSGGPQSFQPGSAANGVSPEMRATIEERKKNIAESRASGELLNESRGFGGSKGGHAIQRRAGMVTDPLTDMASSNPGAMESMAILDAAADWTRAGMGPRQTLISPEQGAEMRQKFTAWQEKHPTGTKILDSLLGMAWGMTPWGMLGRAIPGANATITNNIMYGKNDSVGRTWGNRLQGIQNMFTRNNQQ